MLARMTESEMKERTMDFALRCLRLAETLPKNVSGKTVANQLARSATSVAANYRALCRARSKADFIAKAGVVEEEADETAFWLELLVRSEMVPGKRIECLKSEANELVAIIVASRRTARSSLQSKI